MPDVTIVMYVCIHICDARDKEYSTRSPRILRLLATELILAECVDSKFNYPKNVHRSHLLSPPPIQFVIPVPICSA